MTSISIPLVVSQYQALQVNTAGSSKSTLSPGETISLDLIVKNTGGVVNNLIVSTPENSSFALEGTTQQSLGSVPTNSSINTSIRLTVSSTAAVGQYTIPLVFTYQDVLGSTNTQTLNVGPVNILEPSTQYRLSVDPKSPTEAGSEAQFDITLDNTGTSPITAILDMNSTTAFIPLGVTRVYFEPIGPGESETKQVTIGISSSVSAGYYTLPLTITLGSGTSATQMVGIQVTTTPTITVSATTQPAYLAPGSTGTVNVEIANTGNAAIRSVYANAEGGDFRVTGTSDKFIGTLNVDDSATLAVPVSVPRNLSIGSHTLRVTVTFKDNNNKAYTISKDVAIQAYDSATAAANGATSASGTTGTNGRFTRSTGVLFGLDWIQLGAIAAVLIVGGFFGYRHFKNKKKKVAN